MQGGDRALGKHVFINPFLKISNIILFLISVDWSYLCVLLGSLDSSWIWDSVSWQITFHCNSPHVHFLISTNRTMSIPLSYMLRLTVLTRTDAQSQNNFFFCCSFCEQLINTEIFFFIQIVWQESKLAWVNANR